MPILSPLGMLLNAVENGRLPDALVRVGIRRLLRARLREIDANRGEEFVQQFLRDAQVGPVAAVPEKANEQHYEVPPQLFQSALGHRLKYSSCFWPQGVDSLNAAEDQALNVTCEHVDLADGQDILELGCGWGSLSLWMAEHFPQSRITSVSNSHSQRQFIERRARERELSNLTVVTADINDFATAQSFDRVVSVEMFEHMRNHAELMRRIHSWLRPAGRLFVHIFCHRDTPYLFETAGEHNWMGRHFFSGGMMPSADLLVRSCGQLSLVDQWQWNGMHYAKTCRAWLKRFDAAKVEMSSVLEKTYGAAETARWRNRWRLFFMACEELFAFRRGEEWFVSHYLFERPSEK